MDWQTRRAEYEKTQGHRLEPVKPRRPELAVPAEIACAHCGAPAPYLRYNNGRQRTQVGCKVCDRFFSLPRALQKGKKTKYYCPHCNHALYVWKRSTEVTLYKCGYDPCPLYLQRLSQLNDAEKKLQAEKSSPFKLRYQYREYHFQPEQLKTSAPEKPVVDLFRIHQSAHVLGLTLTFHVSFGLAARTTARILSEVFQIALTYQTVLNYSQAAAFYLHRVNQHYKGDVGSKQAGDETYIKIAGEHAYVFFFLAEKRRQITAYHVADTRDTLPATVTMLEATRTVDPAVALEFTVDGNPSYPAGLHFINAERLKNQQPPIALHQVIGLQNLDTQSTTYRKYKQLIERFNRTYKRTIRSANGFANNNGAIALTTLTVTDYNFLRPHMGLGYEVPIPLPELKGLPTLPSKWCGLLNLAFALSPEIATGADPPPEALTVQ